MSSVPAHDASGAQEQSHNLGGMGEIQQQTEAEQYVTITHVDLLPEKASMLLTNVEMDAVRGKSGICTRVSLPSNAHMYYSSGSSFLSSSCPLLCFPDGRMFGRRALYLSPDDTTFLGGITTIVYACARLELL